MDFTNTFIIFITLSCYFAESQLTQLTAFILHTHTQLSSLLMTVSLKLYSKFRQQQMLTEQNHILFVMR